MSESSIERSTATPGDSAQSADELRVELARAQRLDRDLAGDLGRRIAARSPDADAYVDALGRRRPLGEEAERRLVLAAKTGDRAARAQLVDAFMPLVARVASTYRSGRVQRLELLQEGVVGLLRALERYDPERGVPFWGYATWWVRQAMQQLVAELTRPVVLSDRALRHLARLKQAHHDALQQTGREPSRGELAERSGLALGHVDDLLATERAPRSLEEPVRSGDSDIGTFGDLIVDPLAEDEYEHVLSAVAIDELHALLAGLSDREREVLRARHGLDGGEGQSLRSVGDRLGLSGERVRQIERRALSKLGADAAGEARAAAG